MIGGLLLELSIKSITHRLRPDTALLDITSYSFPSGHATMSIIFFTFVIYAFKDIIKLRFWKIIFISANFALFMLIERVYLNVHWLSDVIAGFGLGLFWVTFVIYFNHL